MILQDIKDFAITKEACNSQLIPFSEAIEKENETEAWSIVLGNFVWLKGRRLGINLEDILSHTNIAKTYYVKGQIYEQYTYNSIGLRQGLYQRWHYNGKLCTQFVYNSEGLRQGLYQSWHKNGQLCTQFVYNSKGLRQGLYQSWHKNGQIYEQYTYDSKGKII